MPKYWENYADLSCDSSAESAHDPECSSLNSNGVIQNFQDLETSAQSRSSTSRDKPTRSRTESVEEVDRDRDIDGTVSRLLARESTLPALEPHQHASLFYLSLIEGRCRAQAVASINNARNGVEHVTEDSPEVAALTEHLFSEMSKELARAGMIPEEFAQRPLPELRLYLRSFDSILQGLATPLQNLSLARDCNALDSVPRVAEGLQSSPSIAFASASTAELVKFSKARDAYEVQSGHPAPLPLQSTGRLNNVTRKSSMVTFDTFSDVFERSQTRSVAHDPQELSVGQSADHATNTGGYDLDSESSNIDNFASMQALVPKVNSRLMTAMNEFHQQDSFATHDRYPNASTPKSVFATEYTTTAILGKGGFGKVLKVKSHLDMAEYAIKRIKYPATKVRQLAETGRMQELLNEVQALARYNHQHVVRYFHAWIETQPVAATADDVWCENRSAPQYVKQTSRSEAQEPIVLRSVMSDLENIALEDRLALDDVLRLQRENDAAFEQNASHVVFEKDTSHPKTSPRSFFRSALEPDSPSDSDDEGNTVNPSGDGSSSTISLSRHQPSETALLPPTTRSIIPSFADCFIYIKMAPYPLTLADFINPDSGNALPQDDTTTKLRHCFHPLSTIRLFLRILSGLSYLHRKLQIHRDLKPANIFLSILEDGEPADRAWVDIHDCSDCSSQRRSRGSCYLSPCIGDFGLVVDLKALEDSVNDSAASSPEDEADEAQYSRVKTPGTKLYIPPNHSTDNVICPKLDTYALGIILLELTHRFDTKSERMIVLEKARHREWPPNFDQHVMASGIKGMMEVDREKRWSCEGIRMWAEHLETVLSNPAELAVQTSSQQD